MLRRGQLFFRVLRRIAWSLPEGDWNTSSRPARCVENAQTAPRTPDPLPSCRRNCQIYTKESRQVDKAKQRMRFVVSLRNFVVIVRTVFNVRVFYFNVLSGSQYNKIKLEEHERWNIWKKRTEISPQWCFVLHKSVTVTQCHHHGKKVLPSYRRNFAVKALQKK